MQTTTSQHKEPTVAVAPPTVAVVASRFVLIPLAAAMTGLTQKAIERKIERGEWIEGKHYRRKDGRNYIDMQGYEAWVSN